MRRFKQDVVKPRENDYGILAGLVATIVLSVLMLLKSAMGMMPRVNAIQMLTKLGSTYVSNLSFVMCH